MHESSSGKLPTKLPLADEKRSFEMSFDDQVDVMAPSFEQLIPQSVSAEEAYDFIGNYERFNQEVGFVLKRMASEQSLSCTNLADETGIPRSTISRYLNAKAPIPLYAFILLCRALNCNMVHVVGRALILLSR